MKATAQWNVTKAIAKAKEAAFKGSQLENRFEYSQEWRLLPSDKVMKYSKVATIPLRKYRAMGLTPK